MTYTILLYLSILILYCINRNSNKRFLLCAFVLVGLYLGVRYNYMPDYVHYHRLFNIYNSYTNYKYDPEYEHVEYGWFVLNRLFGFIGYFGFVFVCSCLFAYANYIFFKTQKIENKYLIVSIFGMITCANFSVLSSAQRQFVATTVFLLAYRYCIYGKITRIRDLISANALIYYMLIWIASMFHASAIILEVIPFLYFFPYKNKIILFGSGIVFIAVLFVGESFLPAIMNSIIEQSDSYGYLMGTTTSNDHTILGVSMMILRVFMLLFVLLKYNINREHAVVLLVAYISALFIASTYSVVQIDRLSFYLIAFDYLSYAIVLKYLPVAYRRIYFCIIGFWFIWGVFKIFQPTIYDWQTYKTIFSVL